MCVLTLAISSRSSMDVPGLGTTIAVMASVHRSGAGRRRRPPRRCHRLHRQSFDLDRSHVLAVGLDDVFASVGEPEDAVGIEMPDVAGVEPAVLERGVGRLAVVQVSGQGVRAR
jgi:hypothetical protein